MSEVGIAFKIEEQDNVATALMILQPGVVKLRGASKIELQALNDIPEGHKIATQDIAKGTPIIKYAVVIGRATADIKAGEWISLHCMESIYDKRSSHLDSVTGKPKDIEYE